MLHSLYASAFHLPPLGESLTILCAVVLSEQVGKYGTDRSASRPSCYAHQSKSQTAQFVNFITQVNSHPGSRDAPCKAKSHGSVALDTCSAGHLGRMWEEEEQRRQQARQEQCPAFLTHRTAHCTPQIGDFRENSVEKLSPMTGSQAYPHPNRLAL